jgi:hypothetical protein
MFGYFEKRLCNVAINPTFGVFTPLQFWHGLIGLQLPALACPLSKNFNRNDDR